MFETNTENKNGSQNEYTDNDIYTENLLCKCDRSIMLHACVFVHCSHLNCENSPLVFVICFASRWAKWQQLFIYIERDRRQIYQLLLPYNFVCVVCFCISHDKVSLSPSLCVLSVSRLLFDNRTKYYLHTRVQALQSIVCYFIPFILHSINKSVCA